MNISAWFKKNFYQAGFNLGNPIRWKKTQILHDTQTANSQFSQNKLEKFTKSTQMEDLKTASHVFLK